MKRRLQNCLVLLLGLILTVFPSQTVLALPGLPGSRDFGSGGVIYPTGQCLDEALHMAADLHLDWVDLPIQWEQIQPDPAQPPLLSGFDALVDPLVSQGIALMFSISAPPAWALTPDGPDPEKTVALVNLLVRHYPGAVRAVELFPGANTRQEWRGQVSAQAYARVFQAVAESLRQVDPSILPVAAGLQPQPEIPAEDDMQDLEFLNDLYILGAAQWMPVVSLQYPQLTGDPLLLPSVHEQRVLRHYEEVRKIMVENHHNSGIIWITQINPPSGTIDIQDSHYLNNDTQVAWLSQAYDLLRSQLYIGVAFLPGLNLNGEGTAAQVLSLIRGPGEYHPFYAVLRKATDGNQDGALESKPGKHKAGSLAKKRP
jgi:hypothetical protein